MNHRSHLTARVALFAMLLCAAGTVHGATLWIGNDTGSPVQMYTPGGTFLGDFGATGATGSALDGIGHVWTVQPGGSDNVITKYDAAQTPLGVIHFTTGIENGNGSPSWIEDMTYGGANTLWLSGFNGIVYRVDATGAILSDFDTESTYVGVTTDGSFLYTTTGFFGDDSIAQRDFSGTVLATVHTTFAGAGGLGFDASTGTFWAGYSGGVIRQFDASGALLSEFTTPTSGAFHDGLEVGDIGSGAAVPEPSTLIIWSLLGAGSWLGMRVWRRRPGVGRQPWSPEARQAIHEIIGR